MQKKGEGFALLKEHLVDCRNIRVVASNIMMRRSAQSFRAWASCTIAALLILLLVEPLKVYGIRTSTLDENHLRARLKHKPPKCGCNDVGMCLACMATVDINRFQNVSSVRSRENLDEYLAKSNLCSKDSKECLKEFTDTLKVEAAGITSMEFPFPYEVDLNPRPQPALSNAFADYKNPLMWSSREVCTQMGYCRDMYCENLNGELAFHFVRFRSLGMKINRIVSLPRDKNPHPWESEEMFLSTAKVLQASPLSLNMRLKWLYVALNEGSDKIIYYQNGWSRCNINCAIKSPFIWQFASPGEQQYTYPGAPTGRNFKEKFAYGFPRLATKMTCTWPESIIDGEKCHEDNFECAAHERPTYVCVNPHKRESGCRTPMLAEGSFGQIVFDLDDQLKRSAIFWPVDSLAAGRLYNNDNSAYNRFWLLASTFDTIISALKNMYALASLPSGLGEKILGVAALSKNVLESKDDTAVYAEAVLTEPFMLNEGAGGTVGPIRYNFALACGRADFEDRSFVSANGECTVIDHSRIFKALKITDVSEGMGSMIKLMGVMNKCHMLALSTPDIGCYTSKFESSQETCCVIPSSKCGKLRPDPGVVASALNHEILKQASNRLGKSIQGYIYEEVYELDDRTHKLAAKPQGTWKPRSVAHDPFKGATLQSLIWEKAGEGQTEFQEMAMLSMPHRIKVNGQVVLTKGTGEELEKFKEYLFAESMPPPLPPKESEQPPLPPKESKPPPLPPKTFAL